MNLTSYHGVFAPNSKHWAQVTLGRHGRVGKTKVSATEEAMSVECRAAMSWAQRLKRVFNIDIETCSECGGNVKVIACIYHWNVMNDGNPIDTTSALRTSASAVRWELEDLGYRENKIGNTTRINKKRINY